MILEVIYNEDTQKTHLEQKSKNINPQRIVLFYARSCSNFFDEFEPFENKFRLIRKKRAHMIIISCIISKSKKKSVRDIVVQDKKLLT